MHYWPGNCPKCKSENTEVSGAVCNECDEQFNEPFEDGKFSKLALQIENGLNNYSAKAYRLYDNFDETCPRQMKEELHHLQADLNRLYQIVLNSRSK